MRALVLLCCFVAWLLLPGQAELREDGGLSERRLSAGDASLEEKERGLYAEASPQDQSLRLQSPDGREATDPEQPPVGAPTLTEAGPSNASASESAAPGDLPGTPLPGVVGEPGSTEGASEEGAGPGLPTEEAEAAAGSDGALKNDTEGVGAEAGGHPDSPSTEQEPAGPGRVETDAQEGSEPTQDKPPTGGGDETPTESASPSGDGGEEVLSQEDSAEDSGDGASSEEAGDASGEAAESSEEEEEPLEATSV
ncbi:sodium/potassium/calcium exchanger 1-like [Sorex fumeus]|uniref:sodium/potassium/calcium exchanger 1-like n=1 Tax=Sorex fumeus TaxID=62283 RepID=UPI0024ACD6E2|nr:sodium/potassium/calcium exchanger 1-like [Sorex fumeus]